MSPLICAGEDCVLNWDNLCQGKVRGKNASQTVRKKNDSGEICWSPCEPPPPPRFAWRISGTPRVQAKVHMQAMIWGKLDASLQGLSKAVPSVSFGGDLSELRPVYTLFTPGLRGGGASRAFASRAFGCAAPCRAKTCLRRPGPDNGSQDTQTATLFFSRKMRSGYTLCRSESY